MEAIISNEIFTKSRRRKTNKRLKMKNKRNKLVINTIAPGFNYRNEKGEVIIPEICVLI